MITNLKRFILQQLLSLASGLVVFDSCKSYLFKHSSLHSIFYHGQDPWARVLSKVQAEASEIQVVLVQVCHYWIGMTHPCSTRTRHQLQLLMMRQLKLLTKASTFCLGHSVLSSLRWQ
jgi:hypothetical protein